MENDSATQRGHEKDLLTIAIFFTMVAIVLASIYYAARLGFSNPPEPVLKVLSISVFLLLTPFGIHVLISKFWKKQSIEEGWLAFAPIVLYEFLFLIIAGLLRPATGINFYPFIASIGCISFLAGVITWSKQGSLKHKLLLLILAGLFASWIAGALWGGRYLKPLFEENLSIGVGEGTLDTLYLSSASTMIASYGFPSNGLDGIPYLKYHYGSQWIFAQVSTLLDIQPLQFYQLGYPVIFVPFTFLCMVSFILLLRKRLHPQSVLKPIQEDYWFWVIFIGANIGFLPIQVQNSLALFNGRQLYSESNGIALGILFLLFLLVLSIKKPLEKTKYLGQGNILLFLVVLPFLTAVLGFVKISFAVILLSIVGYFFLRLKLFNKFVSWIFLIEMVLAFLLAYFCVNRPIPINFSVLNFVRANVRDWEALWFLMYFSWSWLFILFWIKRQNIKTIQDLYFAFNNCETLLVEIVLVVCIVGVLPGMIINLAGNAWYFSDIQRWVAVSFLLAILSDQFWTKLFFNDFSIKKFRQIRLLDLFMFFVVLSLMGSLLLNLTRTVANMVTENLITRAALHEKTSLPNSIFPPIAKWPQLFNNNQKDLEKSSGYAMINTLKSLSEMPRYEKQKTLLFIPQTNRRYWDLMQYCISAPFVAPAISGIAMLDGLPDINCKGDFDYWSLRLRTEPQTLSLQEPSGLCTRALTLGFTQIITINATADLPIQVNKLHCP